MYGIEAMAVPEEVGRCFAAAANAADLDNLGLVKPKFPGRIDDALANAVMAAPLAERGRLSSVFCLCQSQGVCFWGSWGGCTSFDSIHRLFLIEIDRYVAGGTVPVCTT